MNKINSTLFSPREELSKSWTVANMAVVLMLIAAETFFSAVFPEHFGTFVCSYEYTAVAIILAMYLYHQRFSGAVEVKIMAVYTLWVLLTRWLNLDLLLKNDFTSVFSVAFCYIIFVSAMVINREQRIKALNWASVIYGLFSFILASVGLFVVLTGSTIRIPPELKYIGLYDYGNFYTVGFLAIHRNETAVWFYIGLTMMIYQFFACKKKIWRVPITIAAIIDFVAVAYMHSRTTQAVTALSIGLIVYLVVRSRMKSDIKKLTSTMLLVIIVPVVTVFSYKAANWTTDGLTRLSTITTPAFTKAYLESDKQLNPSYFAPESWRLENDVDDGENTENSESKNFSETRNFTEDVTTFTGRTDIWKAVIPTIKSRPTILLKGMLSDSVMEEVNKYYRYTASHMHNFLLQVLMLTGIPGFLMVIAQCLLLAWHMLKMFFAKQTAVDISAKLLTIPVFGLAIRGMMEAGLFTSSGINDQAFFLISGLAMAIYYDAFPVKNSK